MNGATMREVLLHGEAGEAFDRSVAFARQLAEAFGARLHIVYTLEDPLAAGWTATKSHFSEEIVCSAWSCFSTANSPSKEVISTPSRSP